MNDVSHNFYLLMLEHVMVAIKLVWLYIMCAVLVFAICVISYYGAFHDFEIGAPRLLAMGLFALCASLVPPAAGVGMAIYAEQVPKPNK
jgi:hypothetical protein